MAAGSRNTQAHIAACVISRIDLTLFIRISQIYYILIIVPKLSASLL